jgi:hypothetical protein|uniref:Uncharacterized protein n=1 Tax=Zea mays TaxID=4577 RepID=C4J105_MAIZE|nr:unknown [Zea mays]
MVMVCTSHKSTKRCETKAAAAVGGTLSQLQNCWPCKHSRTRRNTISANIYTATAQKHRLALASTDRSVYWSDSSHLLSLQSASGDKLLRHLILPAGTCSEGVAEPPARSGTKQTTITVRLSKVSSLFASMASSWALRPGSSCLRRPLRTVLTACWLLITSHIPSQPMMRNSSSSVRVVQWISGSAIRGDGEPWGSFMSQSPKARVTESTPLRYPSSMYPPHSITL